MLTEEFVFSDEEFEFFLYYYEPFLKRKLQVIDSLKRFSLEYVESIGNKGAFKIEFGYVEMLFVRGEKSLKGLNNSLEERFCSFDSFGSISKNECLLKKYPNQGSYPGGHFRVFKTFQEFEEFLEFALKLQELIKLEQIKNYF